MGSLTRERGRRTLVRDYALYVGIAVVIYGAVVSYGEYQFRTGRRSELPLNWLGFTVVTGIVFVDALRDRSWRRWPAFLRALGVTFALQCGVGCALLWNAPRMSVFVWAILLPLDYVLVDRTLGFLTHKDRRRREPK